jgi:hypothetical protein
MEYVRSSIAICLFLLVACSATSSTGNDAKPSTYMTNSAVQAALQDLASRNNDLTVGTSRCVDAAQWFVTASAASYMDQAASGGGSPAPNIAGSWNFTDCESTDPSSFPALSPCAGTITWSNESGSTITQTNVGATTQGSGVVGWIAPVQVNGGGGTGAAIVQTNDASGDGCSQQLVNLIMVDPQTMPNQFNAAWDIVAIDVVESSSCSSVAWKCSVAYLTN